MQNNQKIPEGWSVKKLGELGSFSKGSGITKNDLVSEGIPCVRYAELYTKYNFVISNCISFVSEEVSKTAKPIKYGDILFAGSGETKEEIGKCAAYISRIPAYAGGDNIILRPFQDNSIFLSYFLNTVGRRYLNRLGQGDSIVHIHAENLKKVYIPIPPLAEQEKIAGILGTWDEAIEKLSDLIEQKKLLKKGLMQRLLTGKTRLPGFTQPWKEVKCKEFLKERKTYLIKGAELEHVSLTKEGVVPKTDRYNRDFLVKQADKEYKITKFHDICYNPANLKFGVICLNSYGEGIFSPIYVTYEIINGNSVFFGYLLTTNNFISKARRYEEGTVYERMAVSSEDFQQVKVFIPSDFQEQEAIADVLSTADEEIDLLNKKLEALKEQKKGLMQQLLTGQTRVKVN